jgi:ATP-dependent Clp protease protease subunit
MNELLIYDDVGPEYMGMVSASYVRAELEKYKGQPVTVRINSPGGYVSEGVTIYNALRRHSDGGGKVTVEVDALAASIASYIAMGGDEILIAENALFMVHRCWGLVMGNAESLRKEALVMDKIDDIIADTYTARSGGDREKFVQLMADETWLTAKESVELGLADAIGQPLNVKAAVKKGRFAKMPDFQTVEQLDREKARHAREVSSRNQIQLARAKAGI